MQDEYFAVYEFPIGKLKIGCTGTAVRHVLFSDEETGGEPTELSDRTAAQLREYFAGKRRRFDLPLDPQGTAFQKRVWTSLTEIPYGETRSYKELARSAGSPRGFRAVGQANHVNPIAIVIPCHRVISADGGLGGYGGGLEVKRTLLALERTVG